MSATEFGKLFEILSIQAEKSISLYITVKGMIKQFIFITYCVLDRGLKRILHHIFCNLRTFVMSAVLQGG